MPARGEEFETHPFEMDSHLEMMNRWLKDRCQRGYEPEELPAVGLVAEFMDAPVAVIFLREIEGGMGLVDGMVTNPRATQEVRHLALDLVVRNLLEIANQLGIKKILAFTDNDSVIKRALRHQFKKSRLQMLVKEGA